MFLLNRKVDNALLILCYLHHKAGGGSAREIAGHFHLSRPFVANILKDLCQKAFVTSQRGVHGGYVLRKSTLGISLADLLDALENPIRLAECNQSRPEECCALAETCPVRGPIEEVHGRLRKVLEEVTLAEIFRSSGKISPQRVDVSLEISRCLQPV